MIFSGPPAPKFIAEMFVLSDMVGEGGPEPAGLLGATTLERNERVLGISLIVVQCQRCGKKRQDNCTEAEKDTRWWRKVSRDESLAQRASGYTHERHSIGSRHPALRHHPRYALPPSLLPSSSTTPTPTPTTMASMLQHLRRGFATSARVLADAASSTTAATPAYPFAKGATFPTASRTADPRLLAGKGLMEHLNQILPNQEKQKMLATLFGKDHPERILPGSVLTVHSTQAPTVFSGVLVSIRRRGPDTSFVLRNVVNRTGVEIQYFVNSPHVTKIDVVRNGGAGKGKSGRRMRRAKLFYLRHSSEKMTSMSAGSRS
jgi:large subunit ribosomal protein L19